MKKTTLIISYVQLLGGNGSTVIVIILKASVGFFFQVPKCFKKHTHCTNSDYSTWNALTYSMNFLNSPFFPECTQAHETQFVEAYGSQGINITCSKKVLYGYGIGSPITCFQLLKGKRYFWQFLMRKQMILVEFIL